MKKTYCDTNILTSSINRIRLKKTLGNFGYKKFKKKINSNVSFGEEEARKIDKCIISRNPLIRNIGQHEPSLGAVLTMSNLNKVEIIQIDGLKKGRELYNKACSDSKMDINTKFYKQFCKGGKLKENKELSHNDLNNIRHFGSAVEIGAEKFLTINKRDFKPLKKYVDIII